MHFSLFLLHFIIESELLYDSDGITSLIAGAVQMQPAIWRTHGAPAVKRENRAITQ